MEVSEEVEWPVLASNNNIKEDMPLSEFASLFVKGRDICVQSIGPCKEHLVKIMNEIGG